MRLLIHGDSIAATAPWPDAVNRAVVGARIGDLAGQLDGTVADAAVVSVGVNDVTDWAHPLLLDGYLPAVEELRRRCPVVLTLGPQLFLPWHPRQHRAVLADRLLHVRTRLGPDCFTPTFSAWHWSRDGIHLNGRGRQRLVQQVVHRLRQLSQRNCASAS